MGLSMAQRKAVTKEMLKRYAKGSKAEKGRLLDELCTLTGWSRRHARRSLTAAALGTMERPSAPGSGAMARRSSPPSVWCGRCWTGPRGSDWPR